MKRHFVLLLTAMLTAAAAHAANSVRNLQVENLSSPLGIDTATPRFSWQLESEQRGVCQTAYQIQVSTSDGTPVWDSGEVESSAQTGIVYAGTPLTSRTAYVWTVTVTDNKGGTASATSEFETAFLSASEWTGSWIHAGAQLQTLQPLEIRFDAPLPCRYVQLNVTELGLRAAGDASYSYVQLSEMEIYAGGVNVALNASLSVGKPADAWELTNYGWSLSYLNDGMISGSNRNGWTTQQNASVPVIVTVDLGSVQNIDRVLLYPRQDDHATGKGDDIAANFPGAFTLQTSVDGGSYDIAYQQASTRESTVPYFGKNITVDKPVKRARMYTTALGVFTMRMNGQKVTESVLEPGESEFEKTILYSTYDVTPFLHEGKNQIVAQVAGGLYNIDYLAGRYSKGEVFNNGETALLAELYVEYADGTSENFVTDDTWTWTASETTGSNWWGGEDCDARLKVAGITDGTADLAGWQSVQLITPKFTSPHSGVSGHGELRSRMYEHMHVVEEWPAVSVKTITSGGYTLRMIDFGRNFAGQYRFRLKGKAGQQISLRCGESLRPDGSVDIQNYYSGSADTYDVYTFRGDAEGEEWGPEFMYHGFRHLQIIGLDEEPKPEDFVAMRIRSDMDCIGSVETSNELVNQIHVICRDAIASQLYNCITDCPQREKLGWLDVPNEMYVSLNNNFAMQNFYKKVVLDCFDAQQANGMVPSVSPYYMRVFEDDPNWGGAAILVPYRNWRYYGDTSLIERYYPQMKQLLQHYTDNTTNYLINNSLSVLSDWGQETAGVGPSVPTEFTETCTYYYLALVMKEMAEQFGTSSDVIRYRNLARNIKTAFNKKFYKSTTGVYTSVSGGGGRQSEQAMPLYYGLVPDGDEQKVADVLAERVKQDGYKIKTGEIALKCVFMSLAKYGYNDIVWQMANQTDCPSYGYWVVQGYTTSPEYWDVGAFSQNHCMMDHIEEWFYTQLGGIRNTGTVFDSLTIAPYLPADLEHLDIRTECSYGPIRSSWKRTGNDASPILFDFTIPAGSVATIIIPCADNKVVKEGDKKVGADLDGIISVEYADGQATIVCGGGQYTFTTGEDTEPTSINTVNEQAQLGSADAAPWFDLAGRPVSTPSQGLYVQRQHKKLLR